MLWLVRVLFALVVFSTSAFAASGPITSLLFDGVPRWVLRAGGIIASKDMNFSTGQYFGCTLASCLVVTRSSGKTNLIPSSPIGFSYSTFGVNVPAITPGLGLLVETTRTNQLLNSAAPVTQTTGTLAATAQTLWVNGTGSAALSNGTATGCSGTATNGSPVTFTPTSGTCLVTVTGSLNAFQLEAGSYGTSLIVTVAAAATRAADSVTTTGALTTIFNSPSSAIVRFGPPSNPSSDFPVLLAQGGVGVLYLAGSNTLINNNIGSATGSATGSSAYTGSSYAGVSWNSATVNMTLNGNTPNSVSSTGAIPNGAIGIGVFTASTQFLDGYVARLVLFATVLTGASLQTMP